MTRITRTSLNFEREPFAAPWGFKGGHISELWQTVARLEDSDGRVGVGLGTQSVLWCDPRVFIANSESAGNALMHLVTGHAVKLAAREPFDNPIDLLELILPEVQAYAAQITGVPDLRSTFALNALVAVDHAAWQLYSHQQGEQDLARLVPEHYAPAIGYPHDRVVTIPTVGYGLALTEISKLADAGFYVFKIKLGSDPAQDGSRTRAVGERQRSPCPKCRGTQRRTAILKECLSGTASAYPLSTRLSKIGRLHNHTQECRFITLMQMVDTIRQTACTD
ncbi:MAG: hypothetical protein ABJA67_11660 [Chthonomonadales bacterium]